LQIDIQRIAKFAALKVEKDEAKQFVSIMKEILTKISNDLSEIKISDSNNEFEILMQLRHDEVLPSMDRESILSNAPSTYAGCFAVPKILE
jgi:aspartyl-tRNA(Asn)/glutamyl-tRNA(Gln) amidotransferase subunit C